MFIKKMFSGWTSLISSIMVCCSFFICNYHQSTGNINNVVKKKIARPRPRPSRQRPRTCFSVLEAKPVIKGHIDISQFWCIPQFQCLDLQGQGDAFLSLRILESKSCSQPLLITWCTQHFQYDLSRLGMHAFNR